MPARRLAALLLVGALAATGLAGCGGDDDPRGKNATVEPGMDPTENFDVARKFFEAVASNDAEAQADALEYAAPDSPAATYLTYLQDAATAYDGSGQDRDADELSVADDGSYRICQADPEVCIGYSGVVLSDGRVLDFTVGGRAIAKRVALGTGDVTEVGKIATLEFLSRDVTRAGQLLVNLHVAGGVSPVTISARDAVLRDADGREVSPVRVVGPDRLGPNDDANVLLVFDGAAPKGASLTLSVSAGGADRSGSVAVR